MQNFQYAHRSLRHTSFLSDRFPKGSDRYTFISPLVALAGLVGFFFAPIYMIKEACRGRVKYDKKERSKDLAASERKRERDLAALSEQCKNVPAVI